MRFKALARAVAVPVVAALLLSQDAGAAAPQSHTIALGTGVMTSATRAAFELTDCDPEGPAKQLNGTDAKFIDMQPFAGRLVKVTFNSLGVTLYPRLYTAACDFRGNTGNPGNSTISPFNLRIPADVTWLVMEAFPGANISFELTVIG